MESSFQTTAKGSDPRHINEGGSVGESAQPCESLQVFLRIRPSDSGINTIEISSNTTVRTVPPLTSLSSKLKKQVKEFSFTAIHGPDCTQQEVYENTTAPLVKAFCDETKRQDGLLFSYGITNAGKTHTIMGTLQNQGLLPQALNAIFKELSQRTGPLPDVMISYLEIYNENIYDLLQDGGFKKEKQGLKLGDRKGQVEVVNLTKHKISSVAEGMDVIEKGSKARAVAQTHLNLDSSRSHSVCSIELHYPDALEGSAPSLCIVDLAGSERGVRTKADGVGKRQAEANKINTSLMTLWRCLDAMRHNQSAGAADRQVVPFRESKLTHLFMNHLQGTKAGNTVILVNINPRAEDYDENQHILANSAIAQKVKAQKDDVRENRANTLLSSTYGFDGRRFKQEQRRRSRKSILQNTPLKQKVPTPQKQVTLDEDSSDEGADSDTCLTDARQSMFRSNLWLSAENKMLKKAVELLKTQVVTVEVELRQELAEELHKQRKHRDAVIKDYEQEDKACTENIVKRALERAENAKTESYIQLLEDKLENYEEQVQELEVRIVELERKLEEPAPATKNITSATGYQAQDVRRPRLSDVEEKTRRLQEALALQTRELEAARLESDELREKLAQSGRRSSSGKPQERVTPIKKALAEANAQLLATKEEVLHWKTTSDNFQKELSALQQMYKSSSLHKASSKATMLLLKNKKSREQQAQKEKASAASEERSGARPSLYPLSQTDVEFKDEAPPAAPPRRNEAPSQAAPPSLPKRGLNRDKEDDVPAAPSVLAASLPKRGLNRDRNENVPFTGTSADYLAHSGDTRNPFEGFLSKLFPKNMVKADGTKPPPIIVPRFSTSPSDFPHPGTNAMSPTSMSKYYGSLLSNHAQSPELLASRLMFDGEPESSSRIRTSMTGGKGLLGKLQETDPDFLWVPLRGPLSPNPKSEELRGRISLLPSDSVLFMNQENNIFKDLK